MNIEELISGTQKKLGIQVDRRAGPETWGAIKEFPLSSNQKILNTRMSFDPKALSVGFRTEHLLCKFHTACRYTSTTAHGLRHAIHN